MHIHMLLYPPLLSGKDPCPVIIDDSQSTTAEEEGEAIHKHALQPETMKQGVGLLSGDGNSGEYGQKGMARPMSIFIHC